MQPLVMLMTHSSIVIDKSEYYTRLYIYIIIIKYMHIKSEFYDIIEIVKYISPLLHTTISILDIPNNEC